MQKDSITIEGSVEKIVYVNEENHYTVASVRGAKTGRVATIVGVFPSICPGETLRLKGRWINTPKYGEQFKADSYESIAPSTVNAIRKYLASGLIKGIGEKFADRIVDKFGKDTMDVIEKDINKLSQVEGVGKKRLALIKEAWAEQADIRELMIFLQGCGVGNANAIKIYKEYKEDAIELIKENPYRLAMDITGIGFKTADEIAQKMGLPLNSNIRLEAGVVFLLDEFAGEGNVYYPRLELEKRGSGMLGVKQEEVGKAVDALKDSDYIVIEDTNEQPIYLRILHAAETGVGRKLMQIARFNGKFPPIIIEKAISWVSDKLSISIAENQKAAIKAAIENTVTVITGGPGVGKTTIVNSIIKILEVKGLRILLAAPTGRAAKRLGEATGRNAMTIHRLLKFNPGKRKFEFNENNHLDVDVVMIDEVSMIDINLMWHLLNAIPVNAKLILVGDTDQLPSVGPGNALKDIINSGVIKTIRLTEIFRQSAKSLIVENAHKINSGEMPDLDSDYGPQPGGAKGELINGDENLADFYFFEINEPEKIASTINYLCKHEVPKKFGFDPVNDIQVLTPMHKGDIGANALNIALQEALNPNQHSIAGFSRKFCVGDKVMQTKNNYDKDVFNGDIGRIKSINNEDKIVTAVFDGNDIEYKLAELDQLILSYAITIHKSQGNEYPAVIVPVSTQHFIMLQRNLIYTAITRGKKLVILVGSKKAISMAVANNKISSRYTKLKERLIRIGNLAV